jgi:hypothetical protein
MFANPQYTSVPGSGINELQIYAARLLGFNTPGERMTIAHAE